MNNSKQDNRNIMTHFIAFKIFETMKSITQLIMFAGRQQTYKNKQLCMSIFSIPGTERQIFI